MRVSRSLAITACAIVLAAAGAASAAADKLDPADTAAAFKAGGFSQAGKGWSVCPKGGRAVLDTVRDLNGDGRPDALIIERDVSCLGGDEGVVVYRLVSRQEDGSWAVLMKGTGDANLRPNRTGWPDLLVGDPTECRRVFVWKTDRFALDHGETDTGKTCILE